MRFFNIIFEIILEAVLGFVMLCVGWGILSASGTSTDTDTALLVGAGVVVIPILVIAIIVNRIKGGR